MDDNADGWLNFREFVSALGMTCTADPTIRLKLLYMIHLPPLLIDTDFESPSQVEAGAEVAAEATDFFDSIEYSTKLLDVNHTEEATSPISESSLSLSSSAHMNDSMIEEFNLTNIRQLIQSKDNKTNLKAVPKMDQKHFIMLWKTLYDMFQTQPDDQETYHSIATVGMYFCHFFNHYFKLPFPHFVTFLFYFFYCIVILSTFYGLELFIFKTK